MSNPAMSNPIRGDSVMSNPVVSAPSFVNVGYDTSGPCDLRIEGATKRYGDFALQGASLAVPRGSVVGLVGRNGAGKTTLMRIVCGSTRPDAGTLTLFGHDMGTSSPAECALARTRLAFVASQLAYPQAMTMRDVVRLYALAYGTFDEHGELASFCQALDLAIDGRHVSELSRGTGMKLQLACALASGADLLVLDEPTAGLDPLARGELLDVLRTWMEDERHSLLISSHITGDLEGLADYLVMLEGGRVLLSCPQDLASDVMGAASLRTDELARVADAWPFGEAELWGERQALSWHLLVPDRAVFRRAFPDLPVERVATDDLMALCLRGRDLRGSLDGDPRKDR